jgi:glycosyltransferase involved in cell wall biosynthesis
MARVGINPARGKVSDYRPKRVTVAVLTYIPDLSGYFEQRLEVLKLVFASLRLHTTLPYDLIVFDNGSCQAAVDFLRQLRDAGQVNYLILSEKNIGKIGALRILFGAAPGEIIAYTDDDILFYSGWLEAHLAILESFPQAGMVSGAPLRNAALHAHNSLDRLVEQGAPGLTARLERRIQDSWEADWALSTGRDPQAHLQATQESLDLVLHVETLDGKSYEAIGSANHFQFVAPRQVILQALPVEWSGKLMGHMIELDEAVDRLGYLRLSTVDRYTRHLGNMLSQEVLDEAQVLGLLSESGAAFINQSPKTHRPKKKHWLLRVPGGRRVLSAIYKRLFDILYQ